MLVNLGRPKMNEAKLKPLSLAPYCTLPVGRLAAARSIEIRWISPPNLKLWLPLMTEMWSPIWRESSLLVMLLSRMRGNTGTQEIDDALLEGGWQAVAVAKHAVDPHPEIIHAEALVVRPRVDQVVVREAEAEPQLIDRVLVEGVDPLRGQVRRVGDPGVIEVGIYCRTGPLGVVNGDAGEDAVGIADMVIHAAEVQVRVHGTHDALADRLIERIGIPEVR